MSDAGLHEVDWEDIDARFSPPPELLGKMPRRVVARDRAEGSCRARLERGCLSGCLAPIFLLGVMMVLWAGLATLILPLGTQGRGVVTECEQGNGLQSTYFVAFRFRANDRDYMGSWQVGTERWRRTRNGDQVTVRYFAFAPGMRPILEEGVSPWAAVLGLGPLGLLMMGIGGISLMGMMSGRAGKQLVRRGIVVPVVVASNVGEEVTFLLRDDEGRTLEIKARSREGMMNMGAIETALYLPGRAKDAQLYRDLHWRAVV